MDGEKGNSLDEVTRRLEEQGLKEKGWLGEEEGGRDGVKREEKGR